MLKIFFCLDNSGVGGTELNAVRTAERLVSRGLSVELCSIGQNPDLTSRYLESGIPVHGFPMESLASGRAVLQGIRLLRLILDRQPHVFHAHDTYGNIFGIPWARLSGVPAVISSRRWWDTSPRPGHNVGNRVAFRLSHAVVANSPRVAERIHRELGKRLRVAVVSNYVDQEAYRSPDPSVVRRLLEELSVPRGRKIIGCVANLRPVKGHHTLLEAMARLVDSEHDVHLVLVGSGGQRHYLESLAREIGILARVSFAGHQPHTPNLHHLFDVSVLASKSEAFPNSLLEAMAAGKPVVATRVGGIPDAVVAGETGLLVPPEDPASLAAALACILSNPALARRMGQKGRNRVRDAYNAEGSLAALTELYENLVGGET